MPLDGCDPDDAFSSVPHEKGFASLHCLQTVVGGPLVFEPIVKEHVKRFAYGHATSES